MARTLLYIVPAVAMVTSRLLEEEHGILLMAISAFMASTNLASTLIIQV